MQGVDEGLLFRVDHLDAGDLVAQLIIFGFRVLKNLSVFARNQYFLLRVDDLHHVNFLVNIQDILNAEPGPNIPNFNIPGQICRNQLKRIWDVLHLYDGVGVALQQVHPLFHINIENVDVVVQACR